MTGPLEESSEGPTRKCYRATAEGRALAEEMVGYFAEMTRGVTGLTGTQSGGALLNLHIHDTGFVRFLCGLPVSVFSSGISRFSGAIDHVVAQYQVPGGAVVSAEGTWLMTGCHGFNMCCTANFEKATVDYDLSRGADALKLFEEGRKPRVIRCMGPDGYTGELRHMIESIQTGKAPTLVTPEDALNAVRICEAEERSIKTGRPVIL